jgi:hypothetical protein
VLERGHAEQTDRPTAKDHGSVTDDHAGLLDAVQHTAKRFGEHDVLPGNVGGDLVGEVRRDLDVRRHTAVPEEARRVRPRDFHVRVVEQNRAEVAVAVPARAAASARRVLVDGDAITWREVLDLGTYLDDLAGELVTEDHAGQTGMGRRDVQRVQVGSADPDGADLDDDLTGVGDRRDRTLLEGKTLLTVEDDGGHGLCGLGHGSSSVRGTICALSTARYSADDVPTTKIVTEGLVPVGGDSDGVLELEEALGRVEHRGLDREHHAFQ